LLEVVGDREFFPVNQAWYTTFLTFS
jgi:hypothetical protein